MNDVRSVGLIDGGPAASPSRLPGSAGGARLEMWLRRPWRWAIPLVLVLLNLGVLSAYNLIYAGRVEVIAERLAGREADLRTARGRRQLIEGQVRRLAARDAAVTHLYEDRFATEEERLTSFITEIKRLGRLAGLDPTVINYPEEAVEDYGLVERRVVFSVEGTYEQLRQLINFLELSEHFVILQAVSLGETTGERMRISLRLATLFREIAARERRGDELGSAPPPAPGGAAAPGELDGEASEPAVADDGELPS